MEKEGLGLILAAPRHDLGHIRPHNLVSADEVALRRPEEVEDVDPIEGVETAHAPRHLVHRLGQGMDDGVRVTRVSELPKEAGMLAKHSFGENIVGHSKERVRHLLGLRPVWAQEVIHGLVCQAVDAIELRFEVRGALHVAAHVIADISPLGAIEDSDGLEAHEHLDVKRAGRHGHRRFRIAAVWRCPAPGGSQDLLGVLRFRHRPALGGAQPLHAQARPGVGLLEDAPIHAEQVHPSAKGTERKVRALSLRQAASLSRRQAEISIPSKGQS
mmetsp:Transcript_95820/g.293035  ORF Transcript_95820/g.293035 Transcript_95820/m.293035 type:complete len:272 (-) Transcript_95820:150-965(-)